jgi:hypothetical protein
VKEAKIDVEVAINEAGLVENLYTTERKEELSAELVEKCRVKAEAEVRLVGGRLRTDRMPEFYIRRGSDLVEGGDYLLVASRWHVDVPNSFDPQHAAARSR